MSHSVSHLVCERYGVALRPGQKGECPFCRRKTFSVRRDDTLGKCFHPTCGRHVTASGDAARALSRVLEELFRDFLQSLLSMENTPGPNAYDYVVRERSIHPQVIADSMIGAVPLSYDLEARFASILAEAEAAAEAEREARRGIKGRPKKLDGPSAPEELEFLRAQKQKLADCLRGREGWLCFFYTDEHHGIVAIRFRKPYAKEFVYFKPFRKAGLFGHGLFSPLEGSEAEKFNERLIVVEGEFSQLQLQSLFHRCRMEYVHACAVGGGNNADFETTREVARCPVLCRNNDDAGLAMVDRASDVMGIYVATTPDADSDLDSFIRSFEDDHWGAWEELETVFESPQYRPRKSEAVASEIAAARRNEEKCKGFEVNKRVAEILVAELRDRGKFCHDGRIAYYFDRTNKKLIEISPESNEAALLLARFGINRAEPIFPYVVEALRVEAVEHGEKTQIHSFVYDDSKNNTVYLSNHANQVYRVTPDETRLVDNGTDGVLFLSDPDAEPFSIETIKDDPGLSCLDSFITGTVNFIQDELSPDQRRLLFTLWFFSLFFPSLMRTRPIAAFVGPKGSGKTTALRLVGTLLFGSRFNVMPLTSDPKDFDAAITNSHLVAIDNADSKCEWLNDRLAIVATGGTIRRRDLYTTNTLVAFPVRCFVGITSRTPSFRRDDVADRLLIMRVDRFQKFQAESEMLNKLLANRTRLMAEVVWGIQEVLRALRDFANVHEAGVFRLADFYSWAMKIGRAAEIEGELGAIFKGLQKEQLAFPLTDDPVVDLLLAWVEDNEGREVTSAQLCKELTDLADKKGMTFPYRGKTRSFAMFLSNQGENLSQYLTISSQKGHAGTRRYSFAIKPEETGLKDDVGG